MLLPLISLTTLIPTFGTSSYLHFTHNSLISSLVGNRHLLPHLSLAMSRYVPDIELSGFRFKLANCLYQDSPPSSSLYQFG